VLNDVLDGVMSRETAARDYKVAITEQNRIDEDATNALRHKS